MYFWCFVVAARNAIDKYTFLRGVTAAKYTKKPGESIALLILLAMESGGQRVFCDTYVLGCLVYVLRAMQSTNTLFEGRNSTKKSSIFDDFVDQIHKRDNMS